MTQTPYKVPRHLAIIMDGNGRWANRRGENRIHGHAAGERTVHDVVEMATKDGVEYLTLFAFAVANWQRSKAEVTALMQIFNRAIDTHFAELVARGAQVRFIGNRVDGRLPSALTKKMDLLEEASCNNTKLKLQIAINYSSEEEMARAEAGRVPMKTLRTSLLDAPDVPEVDLMIRTGADNDVGACWRDSDFLVLQSTQAVKVPMRVYWPAFTRVDLDRAYAIYTAENPLKGAQRESNPVPRKVAAE